MTIKESAAKGRERFVAGPVSVHRMEPAYRESLRIAAILSSGAKSEALLMSKVSFHAQLVSARARRRTCNDVAFVTRLRWAEQWIEIGLLLGGDSPSFRGAAAMIEEAKNVFMGVTSPSYAPPDTELPALVCRLDR
jgi:hypothetical protein